MIDILEYMASLGNLTTHRHGTDFYSHWFLCYGDKPIDIRKGFDSDFAYTLFLSLQPYQTEDWRNKK